MKMLTNEYYTHLYETAAESFCTSHEKSVGSVDQSPLPHFLRFQLDTLCSIYDRIPAKLNGKLLDFGCGANIHAVATAVDKFQEIHMADFCEENRDELLKWIENKPGCIDWTPILEYVTKLKNSSDANRLAYEIRTKVHAIWKCDQIMQNGYDFDKFDAIMYNLCLEVGFPTIHEHSEATHKLANLLKPHGYFVMIGVLEQSCYQLGGVEFPCLRISSQQVKQALSSAGLEICDWKQFDIGENRSIETSCNDYEGAFALLARKI